MKLCNVIRPNVLGWVEYKLSDKEMDYIWRCVDNKKQVKREGGTYDLLDRGDWFFSNCIRPAIDTYGRELANVGADYPLTLRHPYNLQTWWVSYQKKNEFFSLHNHHGVYSFVVWMKIPYSYNEQNKLSRLDDMVVGVSPEDNQSLVGCFEFNYRNIVGNPVKYAYYLDQSYEGTMILFPSSLQHSVYPFYNSDEDRISVAGNISINTSIRL